MSAACESIHLLCRRRQFDLAVTIAFHETGEALTAHWVLQFAQRLALDLSHALARDLEDASDFLERVRVSRPRRWKSEVLSILERLAE